MKTKIFLNLQNNSTILESGKGTDTLGSENNIPPQFLILGCDAILGFLILREATILIVGSNLGFELDISFFTEMYIYSQGPR